MIVCDIFVNIRFQLYRSGVHLGVVCGLLELEVPLRHGHLRVVPQLCLLPLLLSQRLRDLGVSAGLRLVTRSALGYLTQYLPPAILLGLLTLLMPQIVTWPMSALLLTCADCAMPRLAR